MYLFFDSISGGELVVILFFVLIFFGSKNIPEFARTLGKGIRQFKDATQQIQRDIENGAREVKTHVDRETRQIREQIDVEKTDNAAPREIRQTTAQPEVLSAENLTPQDSKPFRAPAPMDQPPLEDPNQPKNDMPSL